MQLKRMFFENIEDWPNEEIKSMFYESDDQLEQLRDEVDKFKSALREILLDVPKFFDIYVFDKVYSGSTIGIVNSKPKENTDRIDNNYFDGRSFDEDVPEEVWDKYYQELKPLVDKTINDLELINKNKEEKEKKSEDEYYDRFFDWVNSCQELIYDFVGKHGLEIDKEKAKTTLSRYYTIDTKPATRIRISNHPPKQGTFYLDLSLVYQENDEHDFQYSNELQDKLSHDVEHMRTNTTKELEEFLKEIEEKFRLEWIDLKSMFFESNQGFDFAVEKKQLNSFKFSDNYDDKVIGGSVCQSIIHKKPQEFSLNTSREKEEKNLFKIEETKTTTNLLSSLKSICISNQSSLLRQLHDDKVIGGKESWPLNLMQRKNLKKSLFGLMGKGRNDLFENKEKMNIIESLNYLKGIYLLDQQRLLHHLHSNLAHHSSYHVFRDYLLHPTLDKIEPLYSSSFRDEETFYVRVRVDNSGVRLILRGTSILQCLFVSGMYIFNYKKDRSYKELKDRINNGSLDFLENKIESSKLKSMFFESEDLEDRFMHDECIDFAFALKDIFGYPVSIVRMFDGSVVHSFANSKNLFIDFTGKKRLSSWTDLVEPFMFAAKIAGYIDTADISNLSIEKDVSIPSLKKLTSKRSVNDAKEYIKMHMNKYKT